MKKVLMGLLGQMLTISMAFAMDPEPPDEGRSMSHRNPTDTTSPMEVDPLGGGAGAPLEAQPQEDTLDERTSPTFPFPDQASVGDFFCAFGNYLESAREFSILPNPDVMRAISKHSEGLGVKEAICRGLVMTRRESKAQRNGGASPEELEARALELAQYPDLLRVMKVTHNRRELNFLSTLADILKYPADEVGKRTRVIAENHSPFFEGIRSGGDMFVRALFSLNEGQLKALAWEENAKTLFARYEMTPSSRTKVLNLLWMCGPLGILELAGYMVPWLDDLGNSPRYMEVLWILMRDVLPPSPSFCRFRDEEDVNTMTVPEAARRIAARREAAL